MHLAQQADGVWRAIAGVRCDPAFLHQLLAETLAHTFPLRSGTGSQPYQHGMDCYVNLEEKWRDSPQKHFFSAVDHFSKLLSFRAWPELGSVFSVKCYSL